MADNKIKLLTEKILSEGVEKGKAQAHQLIADAEKKSDEILSNAREQADKILADARKQASEIKKNTESEMRLAAGQTLQSMKSSIVDTLSERLSFKAVKDAQKDPDYLRSLISKLVANWAPSEGLVIETSDAKELYDYFQSNAKELLDKGLEIKNVAGRPMSYSLKPKDGSYKINFGEEEFENFFKSFLRPRLVELLF